MKSVIKLCLTGLLAMGLLASCEPENFVPKEPELKANFTETAFGMVLEMVYVQGGTFQMGATIEQDASDMEFPVHKVNLNSYHISKYEITQAQWKAVMGTPPRYYKGDNFPVVWVSWTEVEEFCKKLSALTGKKYALPSEAQWEYAARGGNKCQGYKYAGGDNIEDVAWYTSNSDGNTHRVGTKKGNELGIYDMSGNVEEWCSDMYDSYSDASETNPVGPASGFERVVRGGSWGSPAQYCRVSRRSLESPVNFTGNLGFRVVLRP